MRTYGYSTRLIEANRRANPRLLGVRLGRVCIKHKIPVSKVVSMLGVSKQTVYNWFVGINSPQRVIADSVEAFISKINSK